MPHSAARAPVSFSPSSKSSLARATPTRRGRSQVAAPSGVKPRATKGSQNVAVSAATVKSAAKEPQAWELVDASGAKVADGKTTPFGKDAASGDDVQLIDFSSFKTAGQGYKLKVGADESFAFDIGTELYSQLKLDALSYFYQNRSGIEIRKDLVPRPDLARPAGHISDKNVKCGKHADCDYSLDVSGGWYDAGDHGKYVVNGGISLWTLLNQYERAKAFGNVAELGDGKLKIPEAANKVPDILDEARWELEFLLKMQVPAGKPMAGMVHHKMHDVNWTALATAPHEDKQERGQRRISPRPPAKPHES